MTEYRWPVLAWREDAQLRIIVQDFVRVTDGVTYVVEAGYDDFDGASVPRWAWSGVGHPFTKEFERAALVHDYLYGRPDARYALGLGDDRDAVDELFRRHLVEDGVGRAKARMMWWAVQRFGEPRFRCPESEGFVGKTEAEIRAIEAHACDCAKREVAEILAQPAPDPGDSGDRDSVARELREGLALLDFNQIFANFSRHF